MARYQNMLQARYQWCSARCVEFLASWDCCFRVYCCVNTQCLRLKLTSKLRLRQLWAVLIRPLSVVSSIERSSCHTKQRIEYITEGFKRHAYFFVAPLAKTCPRVLLRSFPKRGKTYTCRCAPIPSFDIFVLLMHSTYFVSTL